MSEEMGAVNTDKEIWRETPGDYYSPSISVTARGEILISVSGITICQHIREWHRIMFKAISPPAPKRKNWLRRFLMRTKMIHPPRK